MRRAAKIDGTQKAIVTALRGLGCSAEVIQGAAGTPDLVVGIRGRTELVECKAKKGKLNPAQEEWHLKWKGSAVRVCHSVDEAVAAIIGAGRRP